MTRNMEVWADIDDWRGIYQVSNYGKVKRIGYVKYDKRGRKREAKDRILKPYKVNSGYFHVTLCYKEKKEYKSIHRLVANAFVDNPKNKPCVNHLNEIKTDNLAKNLSWATYKENNNYGTKLSRQSKKQTNGLQSKKVVQKNKSRETLKIWPSISECARNGFNSSHISKCCRGQLSQHKGYYWEYAEKAI